jgi:hypothetical protein
LQPLFVKFWNPWSSKEDQKLKDHDHKDQAEKKISCPFSTNETSHQLPKISDTNEEIGKKTL